MDSTQEKTILPTEANYDSMRDGFEHPDDPKPVTESAIRARSRAISEGRLHAPPRDELNAKPKPLSEVEQLRLLVDDLRQNRDSMEALIASLGADLRNAGEELRNARAERDAAIALTTSTIPQAPAAETPNAAN